MEGFSNGLSTDTIYTDSKKAFDYVNHRLMVFKSRKFGFSDKWCLWLQSYLSNRTQRVLFKNNISREIPVKSGVPQGTQQRVACIPHRCFIDAKVMTIDATIDDRHSKHALHFTLSDIGGNVFAIPSALL